MLAPDFDREAEGMRGRDRRGAGLCCCTAEGLVVAAVAAVDMLLFAGDARVGVEVEVGVEAEVGTGAGLDAASPAAVDFLAPAFAGVAGLREGDVVEVASEGCSDDCVTTGDVGIDISVGLGTG